MNYLLSGLLLVLTACSTPKGRHVDQFDGDGRAIAFSVTDNTGIFSDFELERLLREKRVNTDNSYSCFKDGGSYNYIDMPPLKVAYIRHRVIQEDFYGAVRKSHYQGRHYTEKRLHDSLQLEIDRRPCFKNVGSKVVLIVSEKYKGLDLKSGSNNDFELIHPQKEVGIYFNSFTVLYSSKKDFYRLRIGYEAFSDTLASVKGFVRSGQINSDVKYSCFNDEKSVNFINISNENFKYLEYFFTPSNVSLKSSLKVESINEAHSESIWGNGEVGFKGRVSECYKCLPENSPSCIYYDAISRIHP